MEFDQKQTEQWIIKMKENDEMAFQEFYTEWHPKAFYIALAIMHHEADAKDVAQETMIEVYRSIQDLRDLGYFKLWLNRIIISKCNRIFRKKKAVTMDMELNDVLMAQEENRTEYIPQKQIRKLSDEEVLQELLMKLAPIYAEVLVLMYYEQCSIKEIMQILDIPEGTVKSRLSSAKAKLKNEILAYEEREQVKLNFHGRSLEVLLPLMYQAMADQHAPAKAKKKGMEQPMISHLYSAFTSKTMIGALSILLICSLFGIGYEFYHSSENTYEEDKAVTGDHGHEFDPVVFRNITITNDKEAYFILMKYAHCEIELNELSDHEKEIIDQLLEQIHYENSVYYALWQKRK